MKKFVKLLGLMAAFVVLAVIANPQSAQAAHGDYRVKTLKTYQIKTNSGSDVAFHATPKTKATLWVNQQSVNAKKIKPAVFHKKGIKISKYKTTTWFVQKKVRIYHHLKSANYYYVNNRYGSIAGYIRTNALKRGFSPYGYQITSIKWYGKYDSFHVKDSYKSKNVYMWNYKHTKKVANLKHYPGANYVKTANIVMRHNGKNSNYVYLDGSPDGTSKSIHGYVPAAAITEGSNPDHTGMNYVPIDQFVNNTDFSKYIQTGKNQKLAREIVKLFPNSQPDLGLSKIAVYNYDHFDDSMSGESDPTSTKGYTEIKAFPTIQKWLYAHRKASNATKITGIKKLLDKEGYTASKRASLSGYKIGIQIVNNISFNYPEHDMFGRKNSYTFILGKVDN
ncbi:hypothetical protein [Lentilactobacillus kefiri]|nr:hypothetical protein [Lentilactobacillus kefiri]MCJ2161244.1 D-alanyl-D-alanine carboxypeptidase [Lentilactobacillus kefiri]MCP9368727.1 D-alanyl-D-alanine carboxypeptidase [Lentilactobacillus kefiri]MDH5109399.1 D-alanyl-D-alanine carboxypeptidase [Lentilactobacillus kefiri]MDM7493414.1 D-alanyl-D-alanine carboxypeptidase [Lentilactobacillus kefiri]PAK58629.1 D-alanyl-D-alanine carboxypeptidase [Lentilactobacillus kefiri]